jgi:hypothetical protein
MTRFWLSWYGGGTFAFTATMWPWWISGWRLNDDGTDTPTICAAVIAADESAAKALVVAAHHASGVGLEWRFCNPRPVDWSPFCERFPRVGWMEWPT